MVGAPQHVRLSLFDGKGDPTDPSAVLVVGDATDGGDRDKGFTRGCPHIGIVSWIYT